MSGLVVADAFVEVDDVPDDVAGSAGLGCKSWLGQFGDSSWGFRVGCRSFGCT